MGKMNDAIVRAYELGYYVDAQGRSRNPRDWILSPSITRKYYAICVPAKEKGKYVKIHVHRLCAYQKFGDEVFKPGIVVRHKDNDRLNNRPSNIFIGTSKENTHDGCQGRHGRPPALSDEQIAEVRRMHEEGYTFTALSKIFDVDYTTIKHHCTYIRLIKPK